jgi:hypothetical protein
VLADEAFLQAYSLLSADTVFQQQGEDELSAMFRIARLPTEEGLLADACFCDSPGGV